MIKRISLLLATTLTALSLSAPVASAQMLSGTVCGPWQVGIYAAPAYYYWQWFDVCYSPAIEYFTLWGAWGL